jgi:hypothetical protein
MTSVPSKTISNRPEIHENLLCQRFRGGLILRAILVWIAMMTAGCGQVMIRQCPCDRGLNCDAPFSETANFCQACETTDRFAWMKAKLGWHGTRIKDSVGRCSNQLVTCWHRSPIAQCIASKRERDNAPPIPKFHPVPTHPAFFPERVD